MKLGADSIYIELAGEAFELRPSLRASMRLVRRHGLPGLLAAVQAFNVTIIMDMLRETAIKPSLLLAEIAANGLGAVRNRLTGPLAEFVLAIMGHDPDDTTPTQPTTGTAMPWADYFNLLFETATGSLGWSPDQAWNTTCAEIEAAAKGQTRHLQRIGVLRPDPNAAQTTDHYTPDQLAKIEEQGHDPAFNRSGLRSLKNKGRVA